MRSITFLPTAQADMDIIFYHYAFEREVPHVANQILASIREQVEKFLPTQPRLGRRVGASKDMRAFLVSRSHWVGYTFDDDTIYVHRVIAAKGLQSWDNF